MTTHHTIFAGSLTLALFWGVSTQAQGTGYLPVGGSAGGFMPYPTESRSMFGGAMARSTGISRTALVPFSPIRALGISGGVGGGMARSGLGARPSSRAMSARPPVGFYPFRVPRGFGSQLASSMGGM